MISFKRSFFYLKLEENYFNKGEIIETANKCKLKILQTPHKNGGSNYFSL